MLLKEKKIIAERTPREVIILFNALSILLFCFLIYLSKKIINIVKAIKNEKIQKNITNIIKIL